MRHSYLHGANRNRRGQTMRDQIFRRLHEGELLVLPNAWDAGVARLIESRGAKAIATTSAGLAWANGYPDGDALPAAELLAATRAIARVIQVPLTVDIEGGYSDDPAKVAELAAAVIEAGAVGVNIEDGSGSTDLMCAKIEAVRRSAERAGVALFINARTDVYLRGLAKDGDKVGEVTRRAALYRAAGGDGIFVPGLSDAGEIEAVAAAVRPAPLNIMLVPGLPSHERMQALGVHRLSGGSAIAQAVLGLVGRMTDDLLAGRPSEAAMAEGADYGELNRLFQ
jgi:2-methylisocitrate lyase-like PEP mutase family enzyme